MPLTDFQLLVRLHLLVVEMLGCPFDIVETKFGMLFGLARIVRQISVHATGPVWFAVLEPREQLRRSLFSET